MMFYSMVNEASDKVV